MRWSEAVLREYGNVSSPSVYFVLQHALNDSVPAGLWWMSSFGAGFSCHGALLEVASDPHPANLNLSTTCRRIDPGAIDSRRDLRLLNALMGHAGLFTQLARKDFPHQPPSRIVEIGAGDGKFLLRVAQRLPKTWRNMDVTFVDLQDLLLADTKIEFAALNWRVRSVEADIFEWLNDTPRENRRHDRQSRFAPFHATRNCPLLFSAVAKKPAPSLRLNRGAAGGRCFARACLSLIGCDAVTCHDAPVSVRAGFTGRELSALWPRDAIGN